MTASTHGFYFEDSVEMVGWTCALFPRSIGAGFVVIPFPRASRVNELQEQPHEHDEIESLEHRRHAHGLERLSFSRLNCIQRPVSKRPARTMATAVRIQRCGAASDE
jgi:hypothetical protein